MNGRNEFNIERKKDSKDVGITKDSKMKVHFDALLTNTYFFSTKDWWLDRFLIKRDGKRSKGEMDEEKNEIELTWHSRFHQMR
jgi:hypothetical protein